MTRSLLVLLLSAGLLAACGDRATESEPVPEAPRAEADPEEIAALREQLVKHLPDLADSAIETTPIPGIYEVSRGMAVGYVSADGRFLIEGELVDLATGTQLTEQRRRGARAEVLASDGSDGIVFTPADKADAPVVTVFTDIDCGYCRKMHQEIEDYMAAGIAIQYLLYPRAGQGSASYDKAVSSWCSDDPQEAITQAKAGREIESARCEHPVDRHLQVGQRLGLRGTPMMVLPSGEVVQGYVGPTALASRLQGDSARR